MFNLPNSCWNPNFPFFLSEWCDLEGFECWHLHEAGPMWLCPLEEELGMLWKEMVSQWQRWGHCDYLHPWGQWMSAMGTVTLSVQGKQSMPEMEGPGNVHIIILVINACLSKNPMFKNTCGMWMCLLLGLCGFDFLHSFTGIEGTSDFTGRLFLPGVDPACICLPI